MTWLLQYYGKEKMMPVWNLNCLVTLGWMCLGNTSIYRFLPGVQLDNLEYLIVTKLSLSGAESRQNSLWRTSAQQISVEAWSLSLLNTLAKELTFLNKTLIWLRIWAYAWEGVGNQQVWDWAHISKTMNLSWNPQSHNWHTIYILQSSWTRFEERCCVSVSQYIMLFDIKTVLKGPTPK